MIYWTGFVLYVVSAFVFMGAVMFAQDYLRYARWAIARHGLLAVVGVALLATLTLAIGRQVFPSGAMDDLPHLEALFLAVMGPLATAIALDVRRFRAAASTERARR